MKIRSSNLREQGFIDLGEVQISWAWRRRMILQRFHCIRHLFINCIDLNHPSAAEKSAHFFQQTICAGADRSTLSGVEVNLPSNE